MTAPPRLCESSELPATRALLDAGLSEHPTRGAAERVGAALGLSAGALATLSASSASAAGAGIGLASTGALGAVASAAPSLVVVAGQWLLIGVVSGAGLVGGTSYLAGEARPARPPTQFQAAVPEKNANNQATHARTISRPTPVPSAEIADDSSETEKTIGVEHSPAPAVSAQPAASSHGASATLDWAVASGRLGHEVALVDEARSALNAGDSAHALSVLDAYAALDRTQTLDREAQLLRIEALDARGQAAAASALARNYLRAYPSDLRAPKLQKLVDRSHVPSDMDHSGGNRR